MVLIPVQGVTMAAAYSMDLRARVAVFSDTVQAHVRAPG
jgi:hypothetical protein